MAAAHHPIWKCRDRTLALGERAVIMGILNITPDSLSDGGRFLDGPTALKQARQMVSDGADIIDVGGESTRPGAEPVSASDELARVLPVVRALAEDGVLVSIDTTKAEVARACLDAGARIVNDVTGLTGDPAMAAEVARFGAGLVIMHMQGTPRTMQEHPSYEDVVEEVASFLVGQVEAARAAGIEPDRIVVDPGIGFGKTVDHNLALLQGLPRIADRTGRPVLVGVSRKGFIGLITGREVGDRLSGSLAAASFAISRGAQVIRVHDVKESCDVARVMAKLNPIEGG